LARDPHHNTPMRLDNLPSNPQSLRFPQIFSDLPTVELNIVRGRVRNRVRPVIGPVFLIGGSTECDLVLGDPRVPAVHSYLLLTRRGVMLRHLGEPPYVLVEGKPVDSVQLADGQQISLPPFQFQVRINPPNENVKPEHTHHAHPIQSPPHRSRLHGNNRTNAGEAGENLGLNPVTLRGWN
jgi:hypothetical protein